jgi:hypothetical protein
MPLGASESFRLIFRTIGASRSSGGRCVPFRSDYHAASIARRGTTRHALRGGGYPVRPPVGHENIRSGRITTFGCINGDGLAPS